MRRCLHELPGDPELVAAARRRAAIDAIDAGLRELERQGAVKLPRYCKRTGAMLGRRKCECCE